MLFGALLAALAYCRDVRYDFILDDVPLILMNETITSWHNWKTVFVPKTGFTTGTTSGLPGNKPRIGPRIGAADKNKEG